MENRGSRNCLAFPGKPQPVVDCAFLKSAFIVIHVISKDIFAPVFNDLGRFRRTAPRPSGLP
jgi:hypothetical protein